MGKIRIKWDEIKKEYIEAEIQPTLQELSEKHNCSFSALSKKASKEKWQEQRKAFWKKIEELRKEKKSEIMAAEAAELDFKSLELAKLGMQKVEEKLNSDIKAGELYKLSQALRNFQEVGRLALGENVNEEIISKVELVIKELEKDGS